MDCTWAESLLFYKMVANGIGNAYKVTYEYNYNPLAVYDLWTLVLFIILHLLHISTISFHYIM